MISKSQLLRRKSLVAIRPRVSPGSSDEVFSKTLTMRGTTVASMKLMMPSAMTIRAAG